MRVPTVLAIFLLVAGSAVRAGEPVDNEFFERRSGRSSSRTAWAATDRRSRRASCGSTRGPGLPRAARRARSSSRATRTRACSFEVIRYDGDIKMPQKGKLADADIATLTEWVKGGAPWPEDAACGEEGPARRSTCTRGRRHTGRSSRSSGPPCPKCANSEHRTPKPDRRASCWRSCRQKGLTFAPAGREARAACGASTSTSSACRRRRRRSRRS